MVFQDGPIRYNVRLGDTLRSIAVRHPALRDVSLWRLLAEINNLPTDADEHGVPRAQLKRGTTLVLPSQEQIEAYNHRTVE